MLTQRRISWKFPHARSLFECPGLIMRILYDFTDLVAFLAHSRRFTGVQRAQVDVYLSLRSRNDVEVVPVYFSELARCYCNLDVDRILALDQRYAVSRQPNLGYRVLNEIHRRWKRLTDAVHLLPADILYVSGAGWVSTRRHKFIESQQNKLPVKLVWMFYDLIPAAHPEFIPDAGTIAAFTNWLDSAISRPGKFICISNHSRKDLLQYAELKGHDIDAVTVPLAHEFTHASPEIRPELMFLKNRRFVLSVGSIEIRKNQLQLAYIWRRLYRKHEENTPILVLAGRAPWANPRLFLFLEGTSYLNGQIVHLPDASDGEILWLYNHCEFTVYPSLYEGWGLPIGESLWLGKHCICYRHTSHPEVGGEHVVYCDPAKPASLEAAVVSALDDGIQQRLPDRSELRTWKMVAEEISVVLKDLAELPKR
jgi:glycosyltransferase involved in cell wall biosynthesis